MPFANPLSRSFTASSIRVNAPTLPGVYGISNAREWIFIGTSGNIQASLMDHLMEDSSVRKRNPAGFVFEVCYPERQAARCERLKCEYGPVCNSQ